MLDAAEEESAHVYGLSLGGMIAQELALGRPSRVRRLVLGGTSTGRRKHELPDESTLFSSSVAQRCLRRKDDMGVRSEKLRPDDA